MRLRTGAPEGGTGKAERVNRVRKDFFCRQIRIFEGGSPRQVLRPPWRGNSTGDRDYFCEPRTEPAVELLRLLNLAQKPKWSSGERKTAETARQLCGYFIMHMNHLLEPWVSDPEGGVLLPLEKQRIERPQILKTLAETIPSTETAISKRIESVVLTPQVLERAKAQTANFSGEQMLLVRANVSGEIDGPASKVQKFCEQNMHCMTALHDNTA